MYTLKSFMNIEFLISNVPDTISNIGEISTYSLTYGKDVGQYQNNVNCNLDLYVFKSKDSNVGVVDPNPIALQMCFDYVDWMISRQVNEVFPSKDAFLAGSLIDFSTRIDNLSSGPLLTARDGKKYPTFVSFKCREILGDDSLVTVWLSDAVFRDYYDEYEIEVVAPFDVLDDFFDSYAINVPKINAITYTETLNKVTVVRNNKPETVLTAESFDYVNSQNPQQRTPTDWTVLIYGRYGNDTDAIKHAIAEYILAHSQRTEEQWRVIFPDIFKNTEFLFYPRWKNVAIAEMTLQSGVFSPVIRLKKEIDYLVSFLTFTALHIQTWASAMSHPYKSLQIVYVPNSDNRNDEFDLLTRYPDILTVSSTSLDYNRMSPNTKEFMNKFNTALYLSEISTQYSDLPIGYRKIERDGLLYISFIKDKIRYLINTKLTCPEYPTN